MRYECKMSQLFGDTHECQRGLITLMTYALLPLSYKGFEQAK